MKIRKKVMIPVFIVIILLVVVAILYINKNQEEGNTSLNNNQINSQEDQNVVQNENIGEQNEVANTNSEEENERINSVKEQYGFTGDNSLYTESNNELSIKPDIAYRTALIGSLEQRTPTYAEINSPNVNGEPTGKGVWITPSSREVFLTCINDVTNSFEIDDDGYLKVKSGANNKYTQKVDEIEQQNSLVIVDMTGIDYIVDVVTGDIFKNEFEAMDPYQVYEYFDYEDANKSMIFLNSNQSGKLSNQEIIDTMMDVI